MSLVNSLLVASRLKGGREGFFLLLLFLLLLFPLPLTLASSVWGHADSFRRISAAPANGGEEVGWVEVLTPPPSSTPEVFALPSPRRCRTSAQWPPPTLLLIDPALYINLLLCGSINTSGAHIKLLYQQSPSTVCMLLVWPSYI